MAKMGLLIMLLSIMIIADTTVNGTTPKDTTVNGTTPKDTTVNGTTPKDTTVSGTTPKDTTVNVTTAKVTATNGTTRKDANTKTVLQFSISVNLEFDKDLENKYSPKYQNLSQEFQKKLMDAYHGTPGLQGIEIINLSNGSVKAKYRVHLDEINTRALWESLAFINSHVVNNLTKLTVYNGSVNESAIQSQMSEQLANMNWTIKNFGLCGFLDEPCSFGLECAMNNVTPVCKDKCNPSPCLHEGECYVDYKDNGTKCRCHESDKYSYSGDRCEALSLSAKYYAIISGSLAGFVLLVVGVVLLIRFLKKRHTFAKEDKDIFDDKSDRSVAQASVRMSHMNDPLNYRSALHSTAYVYDSGLPELNMTHRRYRDSQTGEEVILYGQSKVTKPLSRGRRESEPTESQQVSPRLFYDVIGIEEQYKIKRPNLRKNKNWPIF